MANGAEVLLQEHFSSALDMALEMWMELLSLVQLMKNSAKGPEQQPGSSLLRLKCSVPSPSDPAPRDVLALLP